MTTTEPTADPAAVPDATAYVVEFKRLLAAGCDAEEAERRADVAARVAGERAAPRESTTYRKWFKRLTDAGLAPAVAHRRAETIAKQAATKLTRMLDAGQVRRPSHCPYRSGRRFQKGRSTMWREYNSLFAQHLARLVDSGVPEDRARDEARKLARAEIAQ